MSDLTPSDDELISSYLDGEATLDEVARIEADPVLLARVQEFEDAAELLSTPVPPLPQSDVDRLISNALSESATSSRVTDLSAARASRMFNPQRLGTIAAAFLLLAGAVGALFALNNSDSDEVATTSAGDSTAAYDDDDMAEEMDDDGDAAGSPETDMPDAGFGDDMAESMDEAGDDMAQEMADGDDMAESDDYSDDSDAPADEALQPSATVAAVEPTEGDDTDGEAGPTTAYRLLQLELAESYETLDELADQTSNRWRELVAAGSTQTTVPQVVEDQEAAEQALADPPCGQRLSDFINTMDRSGGTGAIGVGETTFADAPVTIVIVELSVDIGELLAASEPNCAIEQLATLTP